MILRLNKQIFDYGTVVTAIKAYMDLATITIDDDRLYWVCSFYDCVYPESLTICEFENYVIDLMNSKHYGNY